MEVFIRNILNIFEPRIVEENEGEPRVLVQYVVEPLVAEEDGPRNVEQDNVEPPIMEEVVVELRDVEQDAIVPPIVEENGVEPPDVEQDAIVPPIVEENGVEPPDVEQNAIVPPIVEENGVEPPDVEQDVAEPAIVEENGMEPPDVEQDAIVPPIVEENGVEPPDVEQDAIVPPIVEENGVEPPDVDQDVAEPPIVEENGMEPPDVEQDVAEPPIMEEVVVELRDVEQDAIVPPIVEENGVEPPDVEQDVAEPTIVEEVVVEPRDVEQDAVVPPIVEENGVEPGDVEQDAVVPPIVEEHGVEPRDVEREFVEPILVEEDAVEVDLRALREGFLVLERIINLDEHLEEVYQDEPDDDDDDDVDVELRGIRPLELLRANFPELRGDVELMERLRQERLEADKAKLKFQNSDMSDPAPLGNESVIYLSRNVKLHRKSVSGLSGLGMVNSFVGEYKKPKDLLPMSFQLYNRIGNEYYDLRIRGARPGQLTQNGVPMMSIGDFQQAELQLQFFQLAGDDWELIHEEPSFLLSLGCGKNVGAPYEDCYQIFGQFAITCVDVISVRKLARSGYNNSGVYMRIYMKLMTGEVDVLHGIQKCFHPDKALFDLKEKMETMLVEGTQSDAVIQSGDNKYYKVHRAVLAANSDIFKMMFDVNMKESKTGLVATPKDVSGEVLETLLKYMYSRNCKDLYQCPVFTTNVLMAAHQYDMHDLMKNCEESLLSMPMESFTLGNILYIFQTANLFDRPALMSKCVHLIMRMDVDLSESEDYMEFHKLHLKHSAKLTEMILRFKKAQEK